MSSFDPTPISFDEPPIALAVPEIRFDEAPVAVMVEPRSLVVESDTEVTTTMSYTFDSQSVQEADIERFVSNYRRSDLVTSEAFNDWHQLRDYVCAAIEVRVGAFPRNPLREKSTFEGFMARWGDKAEAIARRAVEVHDCWWNSAPLSVNRFCKGSDPYFAEVIATQL